MNVDVASTPNEWRHNRKPFVFRTVANAARAPAAICISKQVSFFACTACRKLTQNGSKCANKSYIVHLWHYLEGQGFRLENDTKFGLRGMPGGHTNRLKDAVQKCQTRLQHFQWTGLMAEGGKLQRPDSATDLRLILTVVKSTHFLQERLACRAHTAPYFASFDPMEGLITHDKAHLYKPSSKTTAPVEGSPVLDGPYSALAQRGWTKPENWLSFLAKQIYQRDRRRERSRANESSLLNSEVFFPAGSLAQRAWNSK